MARPRRGVSSFVLSAAVAAVLLPAVPDRLASENVTLTTYYPAPSGVYQQMITTQNSFFSRDSGYVEIGGSATLPAGVKMTVTGGRVGINTTAPQSQLDVNGGLAVGAYGGANPAPANGLIVSGRVGLGTTVPANSLDVAGAAAIGYAGSAAPANGMIVSGNVGIGVSAPTAKLQVSGSGSSTVDLVVNGRIRTGDGGNSGGVWLSNAGNMFVGQEGTNLGFWTATAGWGVEVSQRGYLHINNAAASCAQFWTTGNLTNTMCSTYGYPGYYVAWTPGVYIENFWDYKPMQTPYNVTDQIVITCCPK